MGIDSTAGTSRSRSLSWMWAALAALLAGSACTTVGLPVPFERDRIDYGERAEIRVCALRDSGVSEALAQQLVAAIDREMDLYGIDVNLAWTRPWQRPGFSSDSIVADVVRRPLEAPCDRLLALVGRNLADALWGLVLPEKLGAVATASHTHGYVVARLATPNQLLNSPASVARHEFYHMLGCGHALSLRACYGQIAALKRSHDPARGFFPGVSRELQPLRTRAEVAARLPRPRPPVGAR
jgi:hypothetical protein